MTTQQSRRICCVTTIITKELMIAAVNGEAKTLSGAHGRACVCIRDWAQTTSRQAVYWRVPTIRVGTVGLHSCSFPHWLQSKSMFCFIVVVARRPSLHLLYSKAVTNPSQRQQPWNDQFQRLDCLQSSTCFRLTRLLAPTPFGARYEIPIISAMTFAPHFLLLVKKTIERVHFKGPYTPGANSPGEQFAWF